MIEKNYSYENHPAIFPDIALFDIDIDFELNDGKGAWVVILRRKDCLPQPLPDATRDM